MPLKYGGFGNVPFFLLMLYGVGFFAYLAYIHHMVGPVLYIIGGAVLLYLAVRGRALGQLTFFPGNVTGAAFIGATPIVYAELLIQNTSNVNVTLHSFSANVFTNGLLIGNVATFSEVAVDNNSQAIIPLEIRLQLLGVVQDIIQAIQSGSFKQRLELVGSANADGVQIPIDLTFNIG